MSALDLKASLERILARSIEPREPVEAAELEARALAERLAHEAEQAQGMAEHLARCGLGEHDARQVAAGLSPDFGVTETRRDDGRVVRTSALRVVRRWVEVPERRLMLLCGGSGLGKTLAAGWLMAQERLGVHRSDWQADTWYWPGGSERPLYVLAGRLSREQAFGLEAERARMRREAASLLVVDELCGQEVVSGPYLGAVEHLVIRRLATGRRTLLLSNARPDEVGKRFGDRLVRRLETDGITIDLGDRPGAHSAPTTRNA